MLIRRPPDIPSSEITPEAAYLKRREFLAGSLAASFAAPGTFAASLLLGSPAHAKLPAAAKSAYSTTERQSRFRDVTSYNNFVEFGFRKTDPAYFANNMKTDPWSVAVDGLVAKPGRLALEDILKLATLEERIYRLRCVEAWSMVIPWVGFQLASLLKRLDPQSGAKYVSFETLQRPDEMRGQRKPRPIIPWPYREALRMDEAMHPLTILAVGMYGRELPNQNGAPLRLIVPWKYGFKSIKSIVRISLTEQRPTTSWNTQAGAAYGFYANVNPSVPHPDWSQARERRVGYGSSLFSRWRPTAPFNGYGEHVAGLSYGTGLEAELLKMGLVNQGENVPNKPA